MVFLIIISTFSLQSVPTSLKILITHNDHFHTAVTDWYLWWREGEALKCNRCGTFLALAQQLSNIGHAPSKTCSIR